MTANIARKFFSQPVEAPSRDAGERFGAGAASRIVIVMHDFSSGGTEHVAIRMADAWACAGRRVTIFCGTEHGPLRSAVPPHVRVARATAEKERSPLSRFALAEALAGFAAVERPDIVFAPGNFHLPVLARFRAIDLSGAMTIGKLSNPITRPNRIRPLRMVHRVAKRWAFHGIDCFVAMSPALRAEAATVLDVDRIALAWEPLLDTSAKIDVARPQSDPHIFLAIGRLERQKHFALAIEAFALSRSSERSELLILGEGSERGMLTRLAERLGVADRVTLAGYCKDISGALSRASALLMPSRFEGYPAVAVEAIAAGVPVLATRCSPAIDDILSHDWRSRVVDARPEAFAAAMDAIIANPAAAQLPNAGLHARHDVAVAAHKYLALLDSVCAAGRDQRNIAPHT
jgi:glycosyltransferase involved in cell wall biosynthesis